MLRSDASFIPLLDNDTEITSRSANIVCGRKCGRGRAAWAGVVASQRGDNLWHAPLQRGLRGAAHLSAGNMMWSSSRLFGYSDILIFQYFPFPEPRARLISEPPHDTVCFLHAPRTAHRAQPPGRAQSGGGGWSARTVYCVIYCVTCDMQTSASKSSIRRFVITGKAPTRAFS